MNIQIKYLRKFVREMVAISKKRDGQCQTTALNQEHILFLFSYNFFRKVFKRTYMTSVEGPKMP